MFDLNISRRIRAWLPAVPALLFLAIFFGIPVVEILQGSFHSADGQLGLNQFHRLTANIVYLKVLWMTFLISFCTALGCVGLGYPVAYFLGRIAGRSRSRWLIWLLIPFWTSYLVKTFAWILVLSRTGVIESLAVSLHLIDNPVSLAPSFGGVLIGMIHGMLPMAVMIMLPIMQGVGRQLTQAAETLGASRTESFFTIYLPLSMPGVTAAALLVFITSLGFFIVPALLGTPKETMIAQMVISAVLDLFNLPFAGALSVLLLSCAIIVFLIYDRVAGLSTLGGGDSNGSGQDASRVFMALLAFTARSIDRVGMVCSRARRLIRRSSETNTRGVFDVSRGIRMYSWLVMFALFLPVAIILPIAFTSSPFLSFPPTGFSLRWFDVFMFSPVWRAALFRSLGVATITAFVSVSLGFGAALALTRLSPRMAKATFSFLIAPLIVPRIVTAVGLFYLYARIGLAGTNAGLVIGHTVLAIPYVVVTLAAALKRYDWQLDDAARILGASPLARVRTVMLPLLKPALMASFLFAFLISFDELTIAIFVSGGIKTTLPKQMWDDMLLAANPTLAAVSFVLVVTIALIVFLLSMIRQDNKD
ncbi:MAG: ABC transporter permease subunit [Candidimonas sp.]|nr:MAG: ABC transporter permease subunit [Candidimonas sp.]TAM23304.1 MAG: ABC transporter permease subunit [Candidimonas sp.]TAM77110.1 MAG: ABC transporter permease subunit [Candidimonas sp.]